MVIVCKCLSVDNYFTPAILSIRAVNDTLSLTACIFNAVRAFSDILTITCFFFFMLFNTNYNAPQSE